MSDLATVPYVQTVLAEQDAYRAAPPSAFPRAVRSIAKPVSFLTNRLIPGEVIEAVIRSADWAASGSIRKAALDHDFTDLAACDEAASEVRRWALGYAVTGGGAAGALGAVGLALDVPATIALALRTARLTGLCYGFGGDSEAERVHILDILQLAGANSRAEKDDAIARLASERGDFTPEDWRKIVRLTGQTTGSVAATRRVAATLGVNLSARKVAQIAPVIGAAVGAGVNAAFQNDVATAARFAYRARWIEVNENIVEGRIGSS
ncbi:EcsC family protein [Alphaproteobacteria bacterium GH1-50]|uniref:EcsC family protein n=1 Tax=Kangsaoukella pontilimi TaxID=2691042 RepID=A0A7C9IFT3_9RHOB|nr:EcsC family protein [Kangsaoukella pontilimi]MXQ07788.1 EcsC family protein [Kangsaoukella pontilimi]